MISSTSVKTSTISTCVSSLKCQQQKKLVRRELQNWQKKVPLLLGLETCLSTALGLSSEDTLCTDGEEEIRDWDPSGADDICLVCDPNTSQLNLPSSSYASLIQGTVAPHYFHETQDSPMICDDELFNPLQTNLIIDEQMEPLDLSGFSCAALTDKGLALEAALKTNGSLLPDKPSAPTSQSATFIPPVSSSTMNDFSSYFKASSAHSLLSASSILPAVNVPSSLSNQESISAAIQPASSPLFHEEDVIPHSLPAVHFTNNRSHKLSGSVTTKRVYTEKELTQAVRAICNGHLGTRRAAAVYGIPRSTLRNKICKLHDMKRKEELATGKPISLAELMTNMPEESNLFQVSCRRDVNMASKFPASEVDDKRTHQSSALIDYFSKEEKMDSARLSSIFGSKLLSVSSSGLPGLSGTFHFDEMKPLTSKGKHVNGMSSSTSSAVKNENVDNSFSLSYIPELAAAASSSRERDKDSSVNECGDGRNSPKWDESNPFNNNQLYESYLQVAQQFLLPFLPHFMSAFFQQMFSPEKYEAFLDAMRKQQDAPGPLSSSNNSALHPAGTTSSSPAPTLNDQQIKSSFSVNSLLNNAAVAVAAAASMNLGVFRDLPCSSNSTASSNSSTPSSFDISQLSHSLANGYGNAAVMAAFSRLPQNSLATKESSKSDPRRNSQDSPVAEAAPNYVETATVTPTSLASSIVKRELVSAPSEPATSSSSITGPAKNRSKRGHYRKYNSTALQEAVKAVQSGQMSVHKAGSHYGVPHSTLEYKVKERHLLKAKKRHSGTNSADSLLLQNDFTADNSRDFSFSFIPSSVSAAAPTASSQIITKEIAVAPSE